MATTHKPTLMVIDGHSLAFRAFYALPTESFQTAAGFHTNAIHGFLAMLISLLTREQPDAIAVAFDISRYSFRTELYADYKGTRGETPEEFKGQVPMLQEVLHAMGITTIEKENYEADDILATLAAKGAEQGYNVLLVSGDRDTIQLVNESVTLLYPSKQGVSELTRYDTAKVIERYGIRPEQYPDVAALVGETSDNLPGVPKVGEKTAVKWLLEYGSLASILEHQNDIGGKVGESLREHAHLAERNRRINALVSDVDLGIEPSDLHRADIDMESVRQIFARLEFRSMLERVGKLAGAQADGAQTAGVSVSQGREIATPAQVEPQVKHAIPQSKFLLDEELEAWLDRASTSTPEGLMVHVEAEEEGLRVSVASDDEVIEAVWRPGSRDTAPLTAWLENAQPKQFVDAKTAIRLLGAADITTPAPAGDLMLAAWLVKPQSPAKSWQEALGVLRHEYVAAGGEEHERAARVWLSKRALTHLPEVLTPGELDVYRSIELPLVPILAEMEHTGIAVDVARLETLLNEFAQKADGHEANAFRILGRQCNLNSPKQLQEVLFDELNMPKTRATKTGYTTDAAALAELQRSHPHPFLDELLAYRDATKLKQIVEGLLKSVEDDGRIHTNYGQIGASTGRMSSNDPNLQNIPVRSEDGRKIREVFTHGLQFEGLLSADYSQIEMRIMAHLSEDPGLIEAFAQGEDLHRFVGSRIFSVPPEQVDASMRAKVKAMSYGLVYGLSAFGLARQLNIAQAEAKALIADYFARFGGVRDYLRNVVETARERGYTETIRHRRRPFQDLHSPNRVVRDNAARAALNAPIQGSAADIMKIAMIDLHARLVSAQMKSRLLLQVHDEIIVEVAPGERAELEHIVTQALSEADRLSVPLDVQIGFGATWREAAH